MCIINDSLYNDHVKKFSKYPEMKTPYIALDYSLGILLVLCTVVGVAGNALTCFFFSSKSRRDLVTCLYIVINVTDIACSVTHLPVTISLFNCRRPGIFNIYIFCALWESLFCIIQKFSIYLVLLLSITRTIAIVKPFYKLKKAAVLGSLLVYLVLLTSIPVLQYSILTVRGEFKFSWEGAYCYYNFKEKFEHVLNLILVGMPPIVTFATLVLSLVKLHKTIVLKSCTQITNPNFKESGKHRASMTIAMFTGIFLACNLPYFINLLHNMTTTFFGVKYPGVYLSTRFMYWYSWQIAKIDSVVMNAALNPLLYFCRMKRFRNWLIVLARCNKVRVKDFNDTLGPPVPKPMSLLRQKTETKLRTLSVSAITMAKRKPSSLATSNDSMLDRGTMLQRTFVSDRSQEFKDNISSIRNWRKLTHLINTAVDE